MPIDTPARLAVLGAGPIGLEAALYARFLGYDVVVYERGEIAESVRQCASDSMPVPFRDCRTTLGLAAVQAQDEAYVAPSGDDRLTFGQWRERYLLPLAATDLLGDHLRLHTQVVAIEKVELPPADLPDDLPADTDQSDWSFRVLSRTAAGEERTDLFAGVLDCTGVEQTPAGQGKGLEQEWPTGEDNYFVLGRKAASRTGDFTLAAGYAQIRHAFTIIGDRADLDLYASATRLLR